MPVIASDTAKALGIAYSGSPGSGTSDSWPGASAADPLHSLEEEHRVAALVRHLFYRARDLKRPLLGQWRKNYQVLNNRLWGPRAEPWMPAPEITQIWPVCASLVAWMTDQRPIMEVIPSAVSFSEIADYYQTLAQDMNVAIDVTFSDNLLDGEINQSLWDVLTYGIGYFKTSWEPWLADGLGDTAFRRMSPFDAYPDPWARSQRQMNYFIEAQTVSLDDLDRAFPGARHRISFGPMEDIDDTPHRLDTTVGRNTPRTNLAPLTGGTPNATRVWQGQPSQRGQGGAITDIPVVTVLTCWVKSHKHERPDAMSPDLGPYGITRTIDKWRCVVVCGNAVLMDEPAENINAHGGHPYDRIVLFDTGEWYGPCLVEFLTSPQESINRILGSIEHNLLLMGNPVLLESTRARSRNKRITNRPGQRIEANLNEVSWLMPPVMNPRIAVELLQYYEQKIEAISGMSAIVRGFQPSGRNAQGVLDSVQDAAFVRVRATLRELERALKSVGKKMVANISEFYTDPRIISMLGPDGNRTIKQLRGRHFYVPEGANFERIPMRFNLLMDAGSSMATSRQARSAEALDMYKAGAIDSIELLKAKQWPNWWIVGQRIMEQQAAAGALGKPPNARQASGRSPQ